MREGKIPPNWTDIVQLISQSGAPYNIDLKNTWFAHDLEEDTSETPSRDPIISPDNNNKMLTLPQYKPHAKEGPAREEAYSSEIHKRPASELFQNI